MIFKNWFKKEIKIMQWNDLSILPENNKVVLLYVKNDDSDRIIETISIGTFNVAKGWSIGLREPFEAMRREYSVYKWMQIPLPE